MAAKRRLVLLDAGAVIHAHRVGAWTHLCSSYEVIVPGIVAGEAAFFEDDNGVRKAIDIGPDFASGRVKRYDAQTNDFAQTVGALPAQLLGRIDEGELEALTYLRTVGTKDTAFLSADTAAIEATVVLGFSDVAMSLHDALQASGLTKKLPYEHTAAFVAEAKKKGGVTLAQHALPKAAPARKSRH